MASEETAREATEGTEAEGQDVVIIGGGLAGLSAAYRLATTEPKRRVTIFEMRQTKGGKARSFVGGGDGHLPFNPYRPDEDLSWFTPTVDKGYHIFPAWYWELWDLVETIGFGDNFYARGKTRGDPNPQAQSYALYMSPLEDLSYDESAENRSQSRSRQANRKSFLPEKRWQLWKLGPPVSMGLTVLGLASTSGRTVEEMTVPDYISTRWYNGSERSSVLQDMIVKALANPSKHTSAYTMRQMLRRWIPTVFTGNSWTPARGPLQHSLIDPIVAACEEAGVEFVGGEVTRISEGRGLVAEIDVSTEAGTATIDVCNKHVIVALPPDAFLDIIRDEANLLAVRSLAQLTQLRTAPMGAIDVYFRGRGEVKESLLPENFPPEHFTFIESEFGLTGFPISGLEGWADHLAGAPGLVIQFVVGNAIDIHELPVELFARTLIDEIAEYLDFDPEHDLLGCVAVPSTREQLTMNDAGTWDKRPPANIREIRNLFLAGDYVKLSVDVAGMEAAVESGVNAARAVLLEEQLEGLEIVDPHTWKVANAESFRQLPRPDGIPKPYMNDVVWPVARAVFATINHIVGWVVAVAKWPLMSGHDFVGPLHDRYEDHLEELELGDGTSRDLTTLQLVKGPYLNGPPPKPLAGVTRQQRKKGFGSPLDDRDRLLVFAGLGSLLFGFLAAWLLPARIDGYHHLTDAISVIGRESATRSAYIVAALVGWGGMQLFGAVVRKFVPGAQVLTWMFGWFGWLWLMAAMFPICAESTDEVGTTCDSTMASWAKGVHYLSATGLVVLFVLMPWFTYKHVLINLPPGYEVNWATFRTISRWFAGAALITGLFFGASLVPALDLSPGFAQRLHWSVGNAWIVVLALWLLVRKHRNITGVIAQPPSPMRAVDQRSLWA